MGMIPQYFQNIPYILCHFANYIHHKNLYVLISLHK